MGIIDKNGNLRNTPGSLVEFGEHMRECLKNMKFSDSYLEIQELRAIEALKAIYPNWKDI